MKKGFSSNKKISAAACGGATVVASQRPTNHPGGANPRFAARQRRSLFVLITLSFLFLFSASLVSANILYASLTVGEDSVSLDTIRVEPGVADEAVAGGQYEVTLPGYATSFVPQFVLLTDPPQRRSAFTQSLRLPYPGSSGRFVVQQDGRVLLNYSLEQLCNTDLVCQPPEGYYSCPSDCLAASADSVCVVRDDGQCDPDCASGVDADCSLMKQYPYLNIAIVLLVVGVGIPLVWIFRRRKT